MLPKRPIVAAHLFRVEKHGLLAGVDNVRRASWCCQLLPGVAGLLTLLVLFSSLSSVAIFCIRISSFATSIDVL